jgi:hypothetical protein
LDPIAQVEEKLTPVFQDITAMKQAYKSLNCVLRGRTSLEGGILLLIASLVKQEHGVIHLEK